MTGFVAAEQRGELSSDIGFKEITKKIIMLGLVAMEYQLDLLLHTTTLRDICAYFYLTNEALSIVENAANIGVPLPPQLVDAIKMLKDRAEPKEDGEKK